MNYQGETPFCTEGNLSAVFHEGRFAGGIAASGQSAGFGGNLFTRDSCRMMRDTMEHYPWVTREMLGILPQEQGIKEDALTNEFPDAMPHQVFREIIGGRHLPAERVESAEYWTGKWGLSLQATEHEGKKFVIYNSSDAPLLYLVTLAEYCRLPNGREVLADKFTHKPTNETRTVTEAAMRCIGFVMDAIDASEERGLGLYAVPSTNPNQTSPSGVMRDGWDAYFRPDGDHGKSMDYSFAAYVENQALCYEALTLAATELFPNDPKAIEWQAKAEVIRQRTLEQFWMEDQQTFCAAIDSDGQVQLESTAAVETLNGSFFAGHPEGPDYIKALVSWLYNPDVMTPIGPRMLHKKHAAYEEDYYAYQSTGAVWSVTNGIIAKGLGIWGIPDLRRDLGRERFMGWFNRSSEAVELTYVHRATNEPSYNPYKMDKKPDDALVIAAAEMGQLDQGWGATAALAELWANQRGMQEARPGSWQRQLGRQALQQVANILPASASQPERTIYVDLTHGRDLKQIRARLLNLAA